MVDLNTSNQEKEQQVALKEISSMNDSKQEATRIPQMDASQQVDTESTSPNTDNGETTTTALKAAVDLIDSLLLKDETPEEIVIQGDSTSDCGETPKSDAIENHAQASHETTEEVDKAANDTDVQSSDEKAAMSSNDTKENHDESATNEEPGTNHYTEKFHEASQMIMNQYTEKMQAASVLMDKMIESSPFQESPTAIKKAGYMASIQNLLDSKSPEDGTRYLKTTVVDLLHEVEVLKVKLEESRMESTAFKEEIASSKNRDRQQIDSLVEALSKASRGEREAKMSREQAETLSAEQATAMTIATLTRKIEQQCAKNTELTERNRSLLEKIDDLECESSVKDVKIKALETQFKSINKTRQKVVNQSLQQLEAITTMKDINKENQSSSSPLSSTQSALLRLSTNLSPAPSP